MVRIRRVLTALLAAMVAVASAPDPAWAAVGGALTGRLAIAEGALASGNAMLLLDHAGDLVARTRVAEDGSYRFASLAPGAYRLAVEDATGRLAPVLGPETEVRSGSTTERVVRLLRTSGEGHLAPAQFGPKADSWWSRQTRNQKIFTLVGLVVGAGAVYAAIDAISDDDDDETPASPSK